MIRGTTPLLEFVIPFDTSLLAEAFVTLAQNGVVVLEKRLEECQCAAKMLSVRLAQEETLMLKHSIITEIQLRAKTVSGESVASNIFRERTDRILKDGVI